MVMKITSPRTLNRHKGALQRTLNDFRAGKRIGHLSEMEVSQMITAIEKRLIIVDERLCEAATTLNAA